MTYASYLPLSLSLPVFLSRPDLSFSTLGNRREEGRERERVTMCIPRNGTRGFVSHTRGRNTDRCGKSFAVLSRCSILRGGLSPFHFPPRSSFLTFFSSSLRGYTRKCTFPLPCFPLSLLLRCHVGAARVVFDFKKKKLSEKPRNAGTRISTKARVPRKTA